MKVSVCRKAHFNAAHRLYRKDWSDERNFEVFGKCSYPHYHGHNYELIVTLKGDVDPETGYVMDLKKLNDLMEEQVCSYMDHRNLNMDIAEFEDLIPTAENIAVVIWNRMRRVLPENLELRITLYETERNYVEYAGE